MAKPPSPQVKKPAATKDSRSLSFKPPLPPEIRERVDTIVQERVNRHAGETIVYTSCTGCGGCFAMCPLKFRLKDGIITAIEPNDTGHFSNIAREDSVATDSDLIKFRVYPRGCARKHALKYQIYAPDRVVYPMKRSSDSKRGDYNGRFERITWEEAITIVAEKLKHVKAKHGPYAVMTPFSTNISTLRFLSLYACGVTGWGLSSWDSFRYSMKRILGRKETEGPGPGSNAADILLNSKLIVGWGWVPSVSQNGNVTAYYVKLARERGIPVIWIESRYTKEAECLADQWIPIRPGTDPAMMMAMAYVLFKEDLYDKVFITDYVEPEGFEKWKAYILGGEDGIEKTPKWAEGLTGVPAETIEALARLIARHKPTFMKTHISIARHSFGENVARAAYYLQCMYGHIGTPGAFSLCGRLLGPPVPAKVNMPPLGDWGSYTVPNMFRVHKWAQAILLLNKVKNGELSKPEYDQTVGNAYPDLPLPDYQMAIFEKNITVSSCSNTSQCIDAIKSLDFVVARAWHWNTTAKLADLVIPASEFYEEYTGLATDSAGGPSSVGLRKQLVEPQGEVRPWDWFLTKVAQQLGFHEKFNKYFVGNGDDWTKMREVQARTVYENFKKVMETDGYSVPDWNEFETHPYIVTDEWRDKPFHQDWKADIDAGKLKTPSKKIEFYSEWLATQDPMSQEDGLAREKTVIGFTLPPIARWIPPKRQSLDPEIDHETYPLTMLSPHSRYRGHSCMASNLLLFNEIYRHACWISVADAEARGVADGDLVKIFNDSGQMGVAEAFVTSRIVPGAIALYFGSWADFTTEGVDTGATPNNLVWPLDMSPHYPANTKNCVQVTKISEGEL